MGRNKGTCKVVEDDKVKWERKEAREKRLAKIRSSHREVIFGDYPDTLVIPEGVVFHVQENV